MSGLLLGVLLLVGNAFFVGAEFAVISARRSQIEPAAEAGSRRAKITLRGMENVSLMLAAAQLGITVCSIGLGAVAEPALAHILEPLVTALGLPAGATHAVAFVIALLIVVYLHIVIGEMVPKNLSLSAPEPSALILGPALWGVAWILRPVIWLLNALANAGLRILRITPRDEVAATYTPDEVAGLIAESRREGLLDDQETELASGALGLVSVNADRLIIPDLVTVPLSGTAGDVLSSAARTGFSRFPVRDGSRIVGYLHVRDALTLDPDSPLIDLPLRGIPAVPGDATAQTVAEVLRTRGAHLAEVVDRDGRVMGVLALEDVLEELIGEVHDAAHR